MVRTKETDRHDNPQVEIALYTQSLLHDTVGRASEQAAVDLLGRVFDFARVNYRIHYGLPLQDYQDRTSVCDQPFNNWNDDVLATARDERAAVPLVAKDANVLLLKGLPGGCANAPVTHPGALAVGATHLERFEYQLTTEGIGLRGGAAHALLHEVGHNIGSPANNAPVGAEGSHFGYGFMDGDVWRRTPVVSGNDLQNRCGEAVEARASGSSAIKYLFYHWCTIGKMQVVQSFHGPSTDGPGVEATVETPSPPAPSEYPPTLNGQEPPAAGRLPRPPETKEGGIQREAVLALGVGIALAAAREYME